MIVGPCPSSDQLTEYALGTLSTEVAQEMESHLDHCSQCVETMALLETQTDILTGLLRTPPEPDDVQYLEEEAYLRAVATASCLSVPHAHGDWANQALQHCEESSQEAVQPGSRLGQYVLLKLVGKGGMGLVFRARHEKLGHIVALKVLSLPRVHEPRIQERFRREMQAAGMIVHANVVRAIYSDESDGIAYLVMEFVDGMDLAAILKHRGSLSVGDACELIRMAAIGLEQIHLAGMVHRDLKPGNLMLSCDGQLKIMDLGLALLNDDVSATTDDLTLSGQVMGTIDYMAPEQADDTHGVDFRADIYGLGATLFALLTGSPPLGGGRRTLLKKLSLLATQTAPSLQEACPAAPTGLVEIVRQMLSRDPRERFQNAGEVATALEPFCLSTGLSDLLRDAMLQKALTQKTLVQDSLVNGGVSDVAQDTVIFRRRKELVAAGDQTSQQGEGTPGGSRSPVTAGYRWILPVLLIGSVTLMTAILLISRPLTTSIGKTTQKTDGETKSLPAATIELPSARQSPLDGTVEEFSSAEPALVKLGALCKQKTDSSVTAPEWTIFSSEAEPDLRTDAIHTAHRFLPVSALLSQFQAQTNNSLRAGVLLALSEYVSSDVMQAGAVLHGDETAFLDSLLYAYVNDPDAEVHSCLEYLLRSWGHDEPLEMLRPLLEQKLLPFEGGWFRPLHSSTMVVIPGPRTDILGHELTNSGSATPDEEAELRREVNLPYSFAISTTEVTHEQFWRVGEGFWAKAFPEMPVRPVNSIRWAEAAEFCNRLTQLDGMPSSQQCYAQVETAEGLRWRQKPDALELSGYRMPTDDEWEIACRAGTRTARPFGNSAQWLARYTAMASNKWSAEDVGRRKPNSFGLFDMLGNVSEWIHTHPSEADGLLGLKRLRGGSVWTSQARLLSGARFTSDTYDTSYRMGFRIARTIVRTPFADSAPNHSSQLEFDVGPPSCPEELKKYTEPGFQSLQWQQVVRLGNWGVSIPVQRSFRLRNTSADQVTFSEIGQLDGYFKFATVPDKLIKPNGVNEFEMQMQLQSGTGERSQVLTFHRETDQQLAVGPLTVHGCFDGPLLNILGVGTPGEPPTAVDLGIVPQNSSVGRELYVRNVGGVPVVAEVIEVDEPFYLEHPFQMEVLPHRLEYHFEIRLKASAIGPVDGRVTVQTKEAVPQVYTFPIRATVAKSEKFSSLAIFRKGTWLIDHNRDAVPDETILFGEDLDLPVTGDWNGDGICDLGVWRTDAEGVVTVKLQLRGIGSGVSDPERTYRIPGKLKQIVAADRDGDGVSEIGYLMPDAEGVNLVWAFDTLHDGTFAEQFNFGRAGDYAIIGDWNGDGIDDTAVARPGTLAAQGRLQWEFSRKGLAEPHQLAYLSSYDSPVAGDWDGDGDDEPGGWRPLPSEKSSFWQFETDGDSETNCDISGFGFDTDIPMVFRGRSQQRAAADQ
jgi:serine/threonine protein kinase/formylglycine-generating enzyme required for sulfatase activity